MDFFDMCSSQNNEKIESDKEVKQVQSNIVEDKTEIVESTIQGEVQTNVISENTKNTENTISENTTQTTIDNTGLVIKEQEQKQEEKVYEGVVVEISELEEYINVLQDDSNYYVIQVSENSNKYLLYELSASRKSRLKLTNALPVITKRITYTNGLDEENRYELIVYLLDDNDKKLDPVVITEKELQQLSKTLTNRFIGQVVNYSNNSDKKMREVVEIIGKKSVIAETVYNNTGFIRNDKGQLIYLYHGGYIGTNDTETEIKTDLRPYNLEQYCFTDKEFDKTESLNTVYSLLELADLKIMAPLIAITYLSPMFSLLREEGIFIDFVLLLVGKTGTYKSSLSALLLSHFGNFELDTLPLSFRATFAGIEKVAFAAKDQLLVIDDYKPEKMETDQEKIMEGILGLWGDRNKRIKMNSHGGLHKQYTPRGLAIVTGERAPKFSQGRLARALTVYTEEGSINSKKLREIQSKKEQLAFVMKEYIKWIIANEDTIKNNAKYLQEVYSKKIIDFQHPRIKQNLIVILIGFTMWLDFMLDNSIIDSTKKDELIERASKVVEEIGKNQEDDVDDENPVKIFFKTIGQLQIADKVYMSDYKTGTALETATGTHIGYLDNENNQIYLIADIVYKEVEKACVGRFIATPKQLYKSLADEGYIVTNGENRKVTRRTDPKTKNKVEVLTIPVAEWNKAMKQE